MTKGNVLGTIYFSRLTHNLAFHFLYSMPSMF